MNSSKSKYVRGLQCPKMLWMDRYKPEMAKQNPAPEGIFCYRQRGGRPGTQILWRI